MSILNSYLPFNQGIIQKQDTRVRPSKYAMSPIRSWRFEQSEGIRPAEVLAPYKYLPVAFKDVNTEDWVVIPKGRIISAIGAYDATTGTYPSGIRHPFSSGTIGIGNSGDYMGTGTGAQIDVNIDTSYYGYDDHICELMVLANGGSGTFNSYYTADDVLALTRTYDGTRATASGAYVSAANIPIGVAMRDIYQDIRGEYLNYEAHDIAQTFLTDWYVEVPFVNANNGQASGYNPSPTNNSAANHGTWWDVNKQFTYLSLDTTAGATPTMGQWVCSDGIGNYKIQTVPAFTSTIAGNSGTITTVANPAYSKYNMPKTPQTVGKLIALDTRFPKDSLEDVLTYPRSGMPGSQTAGMIKNLFDFAYYVIKLGSGTAPTVEAIHYAIRTGAFGLARIQLHVS